MARLFAAALCLTALLMVGCQTHVTDSAAAHNLLAPPTSSYPGDSPLGDSLDIVIRRNGRHVQLNNRTAIPFEGVQLWLNRQYVGDLKRINIGDDNRVARGITNHHGEPYPVGGILTPDRNFPIVLAELYDPITDTRHPLLSRDKMPARRAIGEE